jgi:hypothetical protein
MDADRDRGLVEAGEPPWGDVLPGTDTVEYYTVDPGIERDLLFRTVAMEGAFYIELYVGAGHWKVDSGPFSYLGSAPGEEMEAIPLVGREAAKLMTVIDRSASGEQGSPLG